MNDMISRKAAIEALGKEGLITAMVIIDRVPSAQPEPCEDAVPRTSVEYICRKNTVSTNPYEHKYHDKFIQFMNDPEISDFGRWQHSNGFNTALVAVKCDLDKVPSVQPEQQSFSHGQDNDMISRKAAIDAFLTELTKRERKNLLHTWSTVEVKYFVAEMLDKLPSAQPERVHGHWVHRGCGVFECDQCGKLVSTNVYKAEKVSDSFKFCPECGLDMRGEQE